MKGVPVPIKIALLVVGTTALYTYIGQLVPQKQVLPPQVIEISKTATSEELVDIGKGIAEGKGLCRTCHTVGESRAGMRFPDLGGIGQAAGARIEGMDALQYLANSIYYPDDFIVEGYNPGMPAINKPPIGLTDEEMLAVIAYLQSLGGTATVTMDTTLAELGVE